MAVYARPDSPFYWMTLERPGKRPIRRSTRVLVDAATPGERRDQRALAEKIYAAAMGDLARGVYKLETQRPRMLFREHAIWYRDTISKGQRGSRRESSIVNVGLVRVFDRLFGAIYLDELDAGHVEEWKTARAAEVAKQTVNRELDVLKPILGKAIPRYLDTNPADKVKRFRTRRFPPVTILTYSAEDALLEAATDEDRALMLLGLDALLRLGDARRFNTRNDHGRFLEIPDPKTGEPYKVPASERLRKALDKLAPLAKVRGGFYFATKRHDKWRPISEFTAFMVFAALCDRAGVPRGRELGGITFHGLRHTGATRAMKVTKATAVMKLGGWSSLRQLVRYDHPDDPDMIRGVEAIGARPPANVYALERAPS